ncbi:MAG: hypothetical protein U0228_03155 [Myxococcaceae bacterium]
MRLPNLVFASLVVARSAWAGLGGQLSFTGQGVALDAQDVTGTARQSASAVLQENLSLLYAGTPFGPSIAVLTAGLQATNFNGWSTSGEVLSGRAATLDASIGLFPRRAMPLRLYARGTVADGTPQSLPTFGGREAVAFGANVNLESTGWWPHLRADFEELHFTGVSAPPLGDLRRFATLTLTRPIAGHLVSLGARYDQENTAAAGQWLGVSLTGAWGSPLHQTNAFARYVDRQLHVFAPGAPTATVERTLRLDHVQRLGAGLLLDVHARAGDARFDTGDGALGGLAAGATWKPFDAHDFQVALSGDLGLTHTSGAGDGRSAGALGRASYGRFFGPVHAGVGVGGGTQWCGCAGQGEGFRSSVDGNASASVAFSNGDAQASYRIAYVDAPVARGGKRTEHHALGLGHVRLGRTDLTAYLGYDDGFRDYIDVRSSVAAALHETAFSTGGSVTVALPRGSASLDGRYAHGTALIPDSPFVDGPPPTARDLWSVGLNGGMPVSTWLDASLGARATWTTIDGQRPLSTVGVTAALSAHFGRLNAQLQYQLARSDTQGNLGVQHLLRLTLSRPFEVF